MNFSPVNLENELKKEQSRKNAEEDILQQVKKIFEKLDRENARINKTLNSGNNIVSNNFDLNLLESDRIYHISSIQKICVDYRLRFLDSKYFKPPFPQEAIGKIKNLEKAHNVSLGGFKIMAPSKLMKLENADDPLLFAPIGNGYFYLIHKWGNDLHPLRKWLYLPFKTINNTLIFAIAVSLVLTLLVPSSLYDEAQKDAQFWFLFLFIFKAVGFVFIFYGISLGKNFNSQIWNSKYYNG